MQVSLSPSEGRRLALLLAATATVLLLLFALAVALPLIPPKLVDPFWQLAFTGALCTNGFLALLAVLLVDLAALLDPEARWLQRRRQRLAGLCRWVTLAFVLLIPLQGWAAWQALDLASTNESLGARRELARIAQFRQAVVSAGSVAALQANLAAIQAPPLGPEDQRQSLAVLKSSLLGQLQAAEQRARAAAPSASPGAAPATARRNALLKDSLRTLLLSLGLALGFAAAAQRRDSGLSMRQEWQLAVDGALGGCLDLVDAWRDDQEQQRRIREARQPRARTQRRPLRPPSPPEASNSAGPRSAHGGERRAPDADSFEGLSRDQGEPPVP